MKVLSLLPRSRFTESGMTLPETLSLYFLPPNGSHVLIAAAESAQALLLPPRSGRGCRWEAKNTEKGFPEGSYRIP